MSWCVLMRLKFVDRLTEFGETPTSRLTLEEFMNIDLEEEQDPPSYRAARKKHKLQVLEDQSKVEHVTEEVGKMQKMIEKALHKQRKLRGTYAKDFLLGSNSDSGRSTFL